MGGVFLRCSLTSPPSPPSVLMMFTLVGLTFPDGQPPRRYFTGELKDDSPCPRYSRSEREPFAQS